MVKALILGGAGFIGFHLTRKLLADPQFQVTLVDDFSRGANDAELKELLKGNHRLKLLTCDLTDQSALGQLDERFDEIYLFAGSAWTLPTPTIPAKR